MMLHVDDANWGPRPLRMLKCWSEYSGYTNFVRENWGSIVCHGWGGFVLQQKLKMMKASLKEWHYQHCQNLDGKMMEVKKKKFSFGFKSRVVCVVRRRGESVT